MENTGPNDGLITVAQAAELSGKSTKTVHVWSRAGKIRSQSIGNKRLIDRASLEAFIGNTKISNESPASAKQLPSAPQTLTEAEQCPVAKTEDVPDLHGTGNPLKEGLPKPKAPVAQSTSTRKADSGSVPPPSKGQQRKPEPKRKRAPVLFAKDAMRKFNLAEFTDILNWVLARMGRLTKER